MKTLSSIDKAINRKEAIAQGFYDGRFKARVVPDKKKKASKEGAKRWKRELAY
jgi:hypothetical protein